MKDIKVTDSVKYIGVDDHDIDLFESQYVVPNGVSYNSYVILDEKVAVMDTVDARKTDEWLANLEEALDGRSVDYIVVSHRTRPCSKLTGTGRKISRSSGCGKCKDI